MPGRAAGPARSALLACSALGSFDVELLRALFGLDPAEAADIVRSAAVEPDDMPDRFRLRPAERQALLRRLRRERPGDERGLHAAAFEHYLARLRGHSASRRELIDVSLRHLRAVHDLNLHYMRWGEVEALVAALREAAPELAPPDRHQLALYEAYIAQRRQRYDRCEEIVAATLADPLVGPSLRAEALVTRGLSAWSQSRIEAAQADFAAVLGLALAQGDHAMQARTLINQSWIENQLNRFDEALALSRRALAAYERAGDHYGRAYALYSVGNNALYLGDWELGRRCLDQAAAIYRAAGMLGRLALVEWGRGLLHQMLGAHERSKRAYLRALRIAGSPEHGNAVVEADSLFELGLVYQIQRRPLRAEEALRRAAAATERLGDELGHALLRHRSSQLMAERDASVAIRELSAAIETLEQLRFSTRSEDLKIGLLGTAQQVYETMVLAQVERGDIAAAFAYVERARARAFLDQLAGRGEIAELPRSLQPVGLADLQASLAPGALVLEYFAVGLLPPRGGFLARIPAANQRLRDLLLARPRILLFAITAGAVEYHEIACDPNLLQPHPADPAPGWHLLSERKLRWLYAALIAPASGLLASCGVLHIIPHGPLHYLPFAALLASDGENLLRDGGPALAYATSATILTLALSRASEAASEVLAIGYDGGGDDALRYAEREAREMGNRAGGQSLTGPADKFEALVAGAGRLRWLHIAGHAVYLADDPLGSFLRIGAGEQLTARMVMRQLSMRGALVTLNACTSGRSHVTSGDELLGLPRAFLFAGAATIVCTLHEIDDVAAYTLMAFFAEILAAGATPAEALQAAQLRLREVSREEIADLLAQAGPGGIRMTRPLDGYDEIPFAHPRSWAPFILVGRP